jgi:Ca2+-binding EF-hand superfamily protein
MGANDAYDTIRTSLAKADSTGKGHIKYQLLVRILQGVTNPPLSSSQIEEFLAATFPMDDVPISAFLDYIFQRFPGLPGAQDVDLGIVFKCIDTNGNGELDKQEVLAAVSSGNQDLKDLCAQIPSLQGFLDVQKWEKSFKEMDTNSDGVISLFEFIQFFAQKGKNTKEGSGVEQQDLVAVFMCLDKNKNGSLEKGEILDAVNGGDLALKEFCQQLPILKNLLQPDTWKASFEALDTNTDGVITWTEFIDFFGDVCRQTNQV